MNIRKLWVAALVGMSLLVVRSSASYALAGAEDAQQAPRPLVTFTGTDSHVDERS
jgi:hypothetical protein